MINVTSKAAIKEMKAALAHAENVLGFKKIVDEVRTKWRPIPAILKDAIQRAEEKNALREAIKDAQNQ